VAPRHFTAENSSGGSDGFPHTTVWKKCEKNCEETRSLAPKLSRIRGLYGQTVFGRMFGRMPTNTAKLDFIMSWSSLAFTS